MPRINLPGLVDILHTDDPAEIAMLAADDRLDRRYEDRSVVVNGFLLGRVRRVLQDKGKPLPTVTPRGDAERQQAQQALEARLTPLAAALAAGPAELDDLAGFVRSAQRRSNPGVLAQGIVGRLFAPEFQSTYETWDAARVLDQAPRSFNLPLMAWWRLTGRVDRARQLLSGAMGGDRAGLHAIGIAIHNIVAGMEIMRDLWAEPGNRTRVSPEAAAARSLVAPDHILRQPVRAGATTAGDFKPDTVVMLDLQAARVRGPDRAVLFMTGTWSQCPAHAWVPALFEGIWRNAIRSEVVP